MNATILSFNYKKTLIKEYNYWLVLLRPKQVTIGSLVIACKEDSESLADITSEAHLELQQIIFETEKSLREIFLFDKINYLALMMVDKHVHFHVIPRYSSFVSFNGINYSDIDWPFAPRLSKNLDISEDDFSLLINKLKYIFANI